MNNQYIILYTVANLEKKGEKQTSREKKRLVIPPKVYFLYLMIR